MSKCPYTPPFPTPLKKSDKRSWLNLYKRARTSWIHTLYEGSYSNKISSIKLPGMRLFMPKQPEVARKMLTDDFEKFPKSQLMHDSLKPLLGESIFTTNGETWERQRRMLDPAFTNAGLKKVFPLMVDAVKDMKARIDARDPNKSFSIDQEMTHVTADIIMRTILSTPIKTQDALEIFHHFEEFQEKAARVNVLAAFKLPRWLLPHDYLKWKKRGKQIRQVIGEIIESRYKEFHAKKGDTNYGDILEALMQASDEVTDTKFDDTELTDQVVMLFLAGHETSASALSWAFHILANQPETAQAIALEAEATYDSLDSIQFAQVHKLKHARDVFKETLRLYPPVAFFSRVAATDDAKLGNKDVTKGDAVTLSPWLIHRHTDVWKEPHTFQPDRFKQGENKKCPGAYLPFSQGPRICIGAAFAQQEAYLILATVMRHYYLTPDPNHHPEPIARLTLRSANGIFLNIKDRPVEEELELDQQAPLPATTPASSGSGCPFGHG